jgi:hypothetical protein
VQRLPRRLPRFLGLASSFVSTQLVVPVLDLGHAAESDPRPLPATDLVPLGVIGGGVLLVTVLVAVLVSRRVVRRSIPASLRGTDPA